MNFPLLGETCALLAAAVWALAMVLFRASGRSVSPLPLNLFKNTVGLLLLAATLLVSAGLGGQGFAPAAGVSSRDIWILTLSGVLGIAVADTLFFYGLNRVGVGIISIVDCTYTPFVILFAVLLIGERLEPFHFVGVALIIGGVLLASGIAPPTGATRGQLLLGMLAGAGAMGTMGYAIVVATPVLERTSVVWATFVRLLAGNLALLVVGLLHPDRSRILSVFRPSLVWRVSIPGAFLGTYLSLLLWVAGFKYAKASVAAVLNQTSVIFALLLAALLLGEPLTRRKISAVAMALAGVLVVTCYPTLRGQ